MAPWIEIKSNRVHSTNLIPSVSLGHWERGGEGSGGHRAPAVRRQAWEVRALASGSDVKQQTRALPNPSSGGCARTARAPRVWKADLCKVGWWLCLYRAMVTAVRSWAVPGSNKRFLVPPRYLRLRSFGWEIIQNLFAMQGGKQKS